MQRDKQGEGEELAAEEEDRGAGVPSAGEGDGESGHGRCLGAREPPKAAARRKRSEHGAGPALHGPHAAVSPGCGSDPGRSWTLGKHWAALTSDLDQKWSCAVP